MSEDLHSLLGGYVLHALEDHEYALFEAHLLECETCAVDVVGLSEAASSLGADIWTTPPPELKDRIMAEISITPQLKTDAPLPLPLVSGDQQGGPPHPETASPPDTESSEDVPPGAELVPVPRSAPLVPVQQRRSRLLMATLSALLFVGGAGVFAAVQNTPEPPTVFVQASGPSSVLDAPDAKVSSVHMNTGGEATVVLSRDRDALLVLSDGLPALPPGKVYQVWLIGDSGPVPHGTSEVRNGSIMLYAGVGLGAAHKVSVTVEPAGGSAMPTTTPVMMSVIPT